MENVSVRYCMFGIRPLTGAASLRATEPSVPSIFRPFVFFRFLVFFLFSDKKFLEIFFNGKNRVQRKKVDEKNLKDKILKK